MIKDISKFILKYARRIKTLYKFKTCLLKATLIKDQKLKN